MADNRTTRRYQERNAQGLCRTTICDNPPLPGKMFCAKCRDESNAYQKQHILKNRLAAFDAYGGRQCAGCGETDLDVLTIDHEAQDGYKAKGKFWRSGKGLWRWLKQHKYPSGFRVLCWNCQHRARIGAQLPLMKGETMADGIKVRLLPGNEHGQVGEEVILSQSVAEANIAAGKAEAVPEPATEQ